MKLGRFRCYDVRVARPANWLVSRTGTVAPFAEPALNCQSPFFKQKHQNTSTCKVLNDLDCIAAH
jgi:hypothetical protein